ncbi:MAG: hypothetical protein Hyperionvirus2_162 [Hyperionvirus sp.]|uniref:Uncharacterized protein n=1 Tax=Hyperionvirus sp. TaxID=2487770 RepID=A0A3G5A8F5_9VIRU|nr:MAG: hypothetical protein Hyperionvirus2_162 [Hyperionvirus sp.]
MPSLVEKVEEVKKPKFFQSKLLEKKKQMVREQRERDAWFKGVPKVYNFGGGNRDGVVPENFCALGSVDEDDYYLMTHGGRHYIAKGKLTSSRKGFRYCILSETESYDNEMSAATAAGIMVENIRKRL